MRVCSQLDCSLKHYALGFCLTHYRRQQHVRAFNNPRNSCECGGLKKRKSQWCRSCANKHRVRPFESAYNKLRSHARDRAIECDLTYDQFVEFMAVPSCTYCGGSIKRNAHAERGNRPSYQLDRKDSSKEYTYSNMVVCCKVCNRGKSDIPPDEWEAYLDQLTRFRGK